MIYQKLKTQKNITKSLEIHSKTQKAFCVDLCNELKDETAINTWTDHLWEFMEAYDKVLYSELSSFIIDELKDDDVRNIENNIDEIGMNLDSACSNGMISQQQYTFWLKFRDHCKLSILQRRHYNISKGTITSITEDVVKSETDRIQRELTSQLIGLVSIFTALSFVIFGGINILSSVLENIRLATVTRMLAAGSIWTLCMTFLFYIFIRFIIRIIKPDEPEVLGKQFMSSFWKMFGVVAAITIVFVILSFTAPSLFAFI